MRRLSIALLFLCVLYALPAQALQISQRDYAINGVPVLNFSEDKSQFTLEIKVQNLGAPVEEETTVQVFAMDGESKRLVGENTVPPLDTLAPPVAVSFLFDTADFTAGTQVPLLIEVGLDSETDALALNNTTSISVSIPEAQSGGIFTSSGEPLFTLPVIDLPVDFDFSNPVQIIVALGLGIVVLLLLWLLTIILRLIFRRTPKFTRWQPPYANGYHDPASPQGIRQQWQQHAQNGSLLAVCTDGAVHPIKSLLGMDGLRFSGWKIVNIRMSQYDMYGRISRTEMIASGGTVKKLDKIRNKADTITSEEDMQKKVGGVAKTLVKQFKSNITRKSAMLPVALDLRFEGKHGEVRIQFALYRCENWQWNQIDSWEPEMSVIGRTIDESYTYSIHGQKGDEDLKSYIKRLQEDITWILSEMLYQHEAPKTNTNEYSVPDTLTNMEPITVD